MPTQQELEAFLLNPAEALSVEYKAWLDLRGNDEHKAILAKAAIAIANEGGGHIIIGMREVRPNLMSEPRPAEIAAYDQDLINQIIRRFASPNFHCALTHVRHPATGHVKEIVSVPGGFGVPVISKSGTQGRTILPHVCYIRKPGPESAPPENVDDWNRLLGRCLQNRREDMLEAIRTIVEGKAGESEGSPAEATRQTEFANSARGRWVQLTEGLPSDHPARCPRGRWEVDYALIGDLAPRTLVAFREDLRASIIRHTGYPAFWWPTRPEFEPIVIDNSIECWVGNPNAERAVRQDAAHSDFWRAASTGRAFLLRGYQEDSLERIEPGTVLSLTTPIWRIGECLLHAEKLASRLGGDVEILFRARWYGLVNRQLASLDGRRILMGNYVCRQNEASVQVTVEARRISDNLPEIVHPLLAPLYELFSFFELPMDTVREELAEMRRHRFG